MKKIASFFTGCLLVVITFVIIVLGALLFRANERASIKSYIFQMNNLSNQRVGELQNINEISAIDLRNKLIKKYVSEYFKVIPGEKDVENRPVLRIMNTEPNTSKLTPAYSQWRDGEAKTIAQMSNQNMLRIVHVYDDGIATLNRPADYDYNDENVKRVYYAVRYYTETWDAPNQMAKMPEKGQGIIYIEAIFQPGIRKKVNIQKYLQSGENPVGLFKFSVTNIGNKEM